MKRTSQDSPYLSVCLIARNEGGKHEARFRAMFESVRKRAPEAEIVVVLAGRSEDNTGEIAREYADIVEHTAGPRGDWDETPAIDDAAWARQLSFDLAHGTWVGWIDSDDRWPDPEEAERLLKLNGQWCPTPARASIIDGPEPDRGAHTSLEALLRFLEAKDFDVVWCPYLYQRAEDGTAITWQERERFVRYLLPSRQTNFRWAEAAHEILVPKPGHGQRRATLPHFLYIHEKDFSTGAIQYNLKRHYDINLAFFERGDMTTRRAVYLADTAKTFNPSRRAEFLAQALATASTPTDRYRALMTMGTHAFEGGLFWDALQHWGAATFLRPDLPDAWLCGGEHWDALEDYGRAAEWLERGLRCVYNATESYIPPRFFQIGYPGLLAGVYSDHARELTSTGAHEIAGAAYRKAEDLWMRVRDADNAGDDRQVAQKRLLVVENARKGQDQALAIQSLAGYLLDNDEPLKAIALLAAVPWNLKDHPVVIALEDQLAPTIRHATDPAAYRSFYADTQATGILLTPDEWLEPGKGALRSRATWIAEHLLDMPAARVLDVGCLDGIIGIPLLRMCPDLDYTGFDICQEARDKLLVNLEKYGLAGRARGIDVFPVGLFDAAIWTEVIEHVQDMHFDLCRLREALAPDGRLFITTPWGSYDHGRPPPFTSHGTPRGHRGHLRVILPFEMNTGIEAAGLRTEELQCVKTGDLIGDTLTVIARPRPEPLPPVTFAVASALWNWNARESKRDGIGASEGMIIHLAEALARDHDVQVYGPTPQEDIHNYVAYWKLAQLRYGLPPRAEGPVVVSRQPDWGANVLDQVARATCRHKILWLQDACYPDLASPGVVDAYEKIVVVSNWHKQAMHELHQVPLDKMEVIYNFVVPAHFAGPAPERNSYRFVYASSPDRGIVRCLEIWPKIRAALPDAELHLYYGWRGCEKLAQGGAAWVLRYETTRKAFEKLRHQPGIVLHGMIGQEVFDHHLRASSVWLHPAIDVTGQKFTETCCTLALQARAAGCIPVCASTAALAETAASELTRFVDPNDLDGFAQAAIKAASEPEDARAAMARIALRDHSVEVALAQWKAILE